MPGFSGQATIGGTVVVVVVVLVEVVLVVGGAGDDVGGVLGGGVATRGRGVAVPVTIRVVTTGLDAVGKIFGLTGTGARMPGTTTLGNPGTAAGAVGAVTFANGGNGDNADVLPSGAMRLLARRSPAPTVTTAAR